MKDVWLASRLQFLNLIDHIGNAPPPEQTGIIGNAQLPVFYKQISQLRSIAVISLAIDVLFAYILAGEFGLF